MSVRCLAIDNPSGMGKLSSVLESVTDDVWIGMKNVFLVLDKVLLGWNNLCLVDKDGVEFIKNDKMGKVDSPIMMNWG